MIPLDAVLRTKQVYGIIGTIRLITGNYLIAITNRVSVGYLNEHQIWRADAFEIIPFLQNETQFNEHEVIFFFDFLDTVYKYFLIKYFEFKRKRSI
jgi:hypothetical protein